MGGYGKLPKVELPSEFVEPPHNKRVRPVIYLTAAAALFAAHVYIGRGPKHVGANGVPAMTTAQIRAKKDAEADEE